MHHFPTKTAYKEMMKPAYHEATDTHEPTLISG